MGHVGVFFSMSWLSLSTSVDIKRVIEIQPTGECCFETNFVEFAFGQY